MRLTLRTLLAYMDDILDPNDHEELGKKIEASPFATELIHRSRDAVRRLRLSAPAVLASDTGDLHDADHNMDANTAAEYLDSILSPDDVAEFERSCLEAGPNADMLLAEAVSCHHILTLVLGEPAEVDGDLRQRMYELSKFSAPVEVKHTRIEPAHGTPAVQAAAATPVAPVAAVAPASRKQRVDPDEATMPDYMLEAERSRRSGRRRLVGALVGAFALGAVGTALLFPGILSPEVKVPEQIADAERDIGKVEQGVEVGDAATTPGTTAATGDATGAGTTGVTGGEAPPFDPAAEAPPFNPGAATTPSPTTPALPPVVDPGSTATGSAVSDSTVGDATAGSPAAADSATTDAAAAGEATAAPQPPAMSPEGTAAAIVPAATTDPATSNPATAGESTTTPPATPMPPVVEPPTDTTTAPADDAAGTTALPTGSIPSPVTLPPGDVTSAGEDPLMADAAAAAVEGTVGPPVDPTPGAVADAGVPTDAADDAAAVEDAAAAAAVPPEDDRPRQVGAYLGNDDVLLRYDGSNSAWIRLPPRSTLAPGDRLLVFPTFRTHVVLGKDVNAFIAGGTEVTVGNGRDAAGTPADFSLEIPYGRMILNSGGGGNRIALVMGDEVRVIELGPSSSLAVDVKRRFVPGTDPTQEVYPLEINYYLTTGSASWGDNQSAEGQATWTTFDGADATPESIEELPAWINGEALTGLDKSANEEVFDSLVAGQPVNIALLELTDPKRRGKRAEVRGLACNCASYVGLFEPLVNSLGDMVDRPWWKGRIESLREAVARDSGSVELIAGALAVQKGEKATDDLVKMVLGYDSEEVGTTRDGVQEGALVRLIYWLDHEELTYRVLASYNINEITGTMLGGYKPEHVAAKRKGEIRFYTERFDKGDLMPRPWTERGWAAR